MLKIKEVRIKKINNGKFLGYASLLLDNCLIIDGIELYDGEKGRYIIMPKNHKLKRAKRNIAYPITESARNQILDAISTKYDENLKSE